MCAAHDQLRLTPQLMSYISLVKGVWANKSGRGQAKISCPLCAQVISFKKKKTTPPLFLDLSLAWDGGFQVSQPKLIAKDIAVGDSFDSIHSLQCINFILKCLIHRADK